ncbi:hypothetical protein R1sor_017283 [Riccia sorocarpa]|uniref:SAM domain-containing protein n=1 Tax=Riccia sorocarpa TaxID=122646 RepID=A0ABD3I6S4_9MARC
MPVAMEEWRTTTTSGGSKDESVGGDASTGGGGGGVGGGGDGAGESSKGAGGASAAEPAIPGVTHSKRQRRPSVRLGEIGEQKRDSKTELLGHSGRWMSASFVPRKSTAAANSAAKLPRTRPLANVTKGGDTATRKEGSDEGGGGVTGTKTPPVADNSVATEEDQAGTPSSTGRGNYGAYGDNKKGPKSGKRKRASNIRSTTIAKTLGVVSLNRKAKDLQKVLAEPDAHAKNEGTTRMDMEEDSGAARGAENFEEHAQNGDTEVLGDDDGNGEDSSGRQEGDEPESPGVRDNQMGAVNGASEPVQGMLYLTSGVRGWLSSLGLDKYVDLFEENEVDNDVLPLLTFDDLKEMGIIAVGARRKMFAAIQELNRHS